MFFSYTRNVLESKKEIVERNSTIHLKKKLRCENQRSWLAWSYFAGSSTRPKILTSVRRGIAESVIDGIFLLHGA